jgi:hypothetical protein
MRFVRWLCVAAGLALVLVEATYRPGPSARDLPDSVSHTFVTGPDGVARCEQTLHY